MSGGFVDWAMTHEAARSKNAIRRILQRVIEFGTPANASAEQAHDCIGPSVRKKARLATELSAERCQSLINAGLQLLPGIDHGLGQSDRFESSLHCEVQLEVTVAGRMRS